MPPKKKELFMFFTDVLLATHVRTDTFAVLSFYCLCNFKQILCLGSQLSASRLREVDFCLLASLTELNGSEQLQPSD